ncbi:MAG: hypothetical protein GY916_11990, partial [Gammaproteobacteria bacterium]|nr:hypothetical protein [Gammaproteobacteria bacterium]
DYDLLLSELRNASLFDLYRLQAAIGRLLDDPARQVAVKRLLRPGMETTYFDTQANRLVPARVLQVRKSRVLVEDLETGKRWTIPVYLFNLQGENPDLTPPGNSVDRLSLRIGDRVGFTGRDGQELMGTVIKLNPKRAKLETPEGIWNVPYSLLFPVIEGGHGHDALLPRAD